MKKRKFNILLNIAVLCMCVCAIAIGVYSAKTASLSVSGTIGFKAHNTNIELTGSIVACESSDSTTRKTATITSTNINSNTSLNLNEQFGGSTSGKMYFSDLFDDGKTIVITLTLTNNSDYPVKATANLPTFTGSNYSRNVKLANTVITETQIVTIAKKDTLTMTITLTLTSDEVGITDAGISGTLFSFEPKLTDTINFTFKYYYDDSENAILIDESIPCQAKEGMTVGEWVESDYYKNTPTYDEMEGYFTFDYDRFTFFWNLSLSEVLVDGKSYESTGEPSGV